MTDENDPTDDDEIIEAELVDEEALDEGAGQDAVSDRPIGRRVRLTSIVGIACLLLTFMGIVLFSLTIPAVADPEGARCAFAQREIDAANEDDEDYNDVVVDDEQVADAGDLSCEEALSLASSIPTSEDGDDVLSIPSPSTVRTSSALAAVLGMLQCVTGVGTLMVASRAFRTAAATSALVGTVIAVVPILPLVIGIFAVWALLFSRQAKSIWGPLRFLGGSRRSSGA